MNFEDRLRQSFLAAETSLPGGRLTVEATIERAKRLSVTRLASIVVASVIVLAGGAFAVEAISDRGAGTVGPSGPDERVNPAPTDDTEDPTPPGDSDGLEGSDTVPDCTGGLECPVSPDDAPNGRYADKPTTADISQNGFVPPLGTRNGPCSAAQDFGRIVPVGDQSVILSPAGVEMRTRIIGAAWACDYRLLEELAWGQEPVGAFSYTPRDVQMKASPAELWGLWERQGREVLARLIATLETEPTVLKGAPGGDVYVWPNIRLTQDFPREFPYQVTIDDSGDWRSFRPAGD